MAESGGAMAPGQARTKAGIGPGGGSAVSGLGPQAAAVLAAAY